LQAPAPEAFPAGEIIAKVACAADPEETYALYLPPGVDRSKPRPILYLLDARRRGGLGVERFREAADAYGWILASSNNSESDGPFAPNVRAMRAMWTDTHRRFAIDPRRAYVTGLSGGARAACLLAQTAEPNQIAGVIGCAAGFPDNLPPSKDVRFVYFGTVGNRDFNYREMRQLEPTLEALGIRHRLAVFDGPHDWPTPAVAIRAVEWMELEAMRSGLRERDEALLARWLARASEEAGALEAAGQKGEALVRYREAAQDFGGLTDTAGLTAAVARLEKDPEAARQIERQARLEQEEDRTFHEVSQKLMADLQSEDPIPAQRVAQDIRLPALQRTAQSGATDAERQSAKRVLAALSVQTSFYLPRQYLEHRDSRRAQLCVAIAAEVNPQRSWAAWYNFACLQAQAGDKKAALASLRTAVDRGFHDVALVERDPDLDTLREQEGYRKLVDELKASASAH